MSAGVWKAHASRYNVAVMFKGVSGEELNYPHDAERNWRVSRHRVEPIEKPPETPRTSHQYRKVRSSNCAPWCRKGGPISPPLICHTVVRWILHPGDGERECLQPGGNLICGLFCSGFGFVGRFKLTKKNTYKFHVVYIYMYITYIFIYNFGYICIYTRYKLQSKIA